MSGRVGRRSAVFLLVALLLATLQVPGTANAGGDPRTVGTPDLMTVNGYDDYQVNRRVDVVQRSSGNNLVFWFTARRALVDGTVTIELPARDWPTPLHVPAFDGLDPQSAGHVGVRPTAQWPGPGDPGQYCGLGSSYTLPNGTAHAYLFELTATNTDRVRRIEAAHLTCAAGQKIAIRIVGLTAPNAGPERFTVRVRDVDGSRRVAEPHLVVKRTPSVRLMIDDLTPTVSAATPGGTSVHVRAVGPGGRPVPNYSGTIRLYTDPRDCTVENRGFKDVEVTPARKGHYQLTYPFGLAGDYTLIAEDVDQRAVAARSNRFTVVDGNPAPVCPASYH